MEWQVGDCSTLLSNPLDQSAIAADDFRRRLAKRSNNNNFLDDHRDVTNLHIYVES